MRNVEYQKHSYRLSEGIARRLRSMKSERGMSYNLLFTELLSHYEQSTSNGGTNKHGYGVHRTPNHDAGMEGREAQEAHAPVTVRTYFKHGKSSTRTQRNRT